MDSLLSAVSGQFGKALIFGTLLPVIVFVLLAWLLVVPLIPGDLRVLDAFTALEPEWRLAAASFTILVVAGLLLSLNTPLIRFYEGYPWKESWIGRWIVRRQQARFDSLSKRWRGLRTLMYATPPPPPFLERKSRLTERWRQVGLALNREFPDRVDLVLPTRLGNLIRSFESYPRAQYGMESIVLWPRLVGAMDKDYAAAVDETKASFDFMLNSAVLSGATAAGLLVVGLIWPAPLAIPGGLARWLLQVFILAALSHWFYLLSIARAAAWGEMVKGAFDLYRAALLRQLGYQQAPATSQEERRLWDDISTQMIYGDSPRVDPAAYSLVGCSARGGPARVDLRVGRGVIHGSNPGELIVILRVENVDRQGRGARNVVVTDTLLDNYDYRWNSAKAGGHGVRVTGSNPLEFDLGDLSHGQSIELTYHTLARSSG